MRSSKARSRSKSNRNRSVGNVVNRVFDSSGPEGKVRGTPQQIIDKYGQLARDASLSNDRVAYENFQQHAEHYTRLLSEAQREQDARREQQEREQEARRGDRGEGGNRQNGGERQNSGDRQNGGGDRQNDRSQPPAPQQSSGDDDRGVIDMASGADGDAGLVETPESKPKRNRRPRKQNNQDAPADGPVSDDRTDAADTKPADASEVGPEAAE
jgi:hypothetical protein